MTTFTVYVTAYDLEKSLIFEKAVEITCAFRFMCKYAVHNTCYISHGMGVRKVSNSKSDLRSLKIVVPFDRPHTISY